jgi:hypothetical protein
MAKQYLFRWPVAASIAAALAVSGCAHVESSGRERERERAEARLAKMLEGRVAGQPRSCVSAFDSSRLQILDRTAVVYDAGGIIWVARPDNPDSLDTRDVVVIRRTGGQLCKEDLIRTVDRTGHFTTGVVFLGDFVPYRRP